MPDAILIDDRTGAVRRCKIPSTPQDPSVAFARIVERVLGEGGVRASAVGLAVHGTTVATNAIIEGELARTGFVATEGFRDMLEIARQTRPALYDLQFEKPSPLVPRFLAFGVRERLDAQGNVLIKLNEVDVQRAARGLRAQAVEAVPICFLHSYLNPVHEMRAAEILAKMLPGTPLSVSSTVAPEFREYLRASTTVINASIQPVVVRYLQRVEDALRARGLAGKLLLMQSNGGVTPFAAAAERPVSIVESGPAAGVVAAAHLGKTLARRNLVSLDMGGHNRQGWSGARRIPGGDQGVRSGRNRSRRGRRDARKRVSDPYAGDRSGRDRRGWGFNRVGGYRGRASGRAPECWGRPGPSLLWLGRD
jgi:N-methylhydantoinase A